MTAAADAGVAASTRCLNAGVTASTDTATLWRAVRVQIAGLKPMEKVLRAAIAERADALRRLSTGRKRAKAEAALNGKLPLMAMHPPSALGATSEAFLDALLGFIEANDGGVLQRQGSAVDEEDGAGRLFRPQPRVEDDTFMRLMQLKYMQSQVRKGVDAWVVGSSRWACVGMQCGAGAHTSLLMQLVHFKCMHMGYMWGRVWRCG
eukprot:365111-Chlamydomonas_euryale.AAC.11